MTTQHVLSILLCFAFVPLASCGGGDKPATPEQQSGMVEVIDSARIYLKGSKRFQRLGITEAPEIDSTADIFVSGEETIRMVSPGIIAVLRGDSAEILFGLTIPEDSTGETKRDAIVRMVRDNGTWRGDGVYVVE